MANSEAHAPRLFADAAAVRRVGEGLLARTLPRPEWTHEAHLAATAWLLRQRPEIVLAAELPAIIRSYNESVGGVNDDTQGYHETLTQLYIRTVTAFLRDRPSDEAIAEAVNALLTAEQGRRDWPLRFYSRDRLFSVAARRGWVEPDVAPLP